MEIKVLVLEDGAMHQVIIGLISLVKIGEEKIRRGRNKRNRKRKKEFKPYHIMHTLSCDFTTSIPEFKMKFAKEKYQAVILSGELLEDENLMKELARWIRSNNLETRIGLNSSEYSDSLAKEVGAANLVKEPDKIKHFFTLLLDEV